MSADRAAERAAEVRRVAVELCELCLSGTGGECHTPGCALWFSRAPDVPVTHEPVPADQADHAETLGALNQATRERDEARAAIAKAYEHAAHQAGVTSFATAKAWKRQMYLLKEGGDV